MEQPSYITIGWIDEKISHVDLYQMYFLFLFLVLYYHLPFICQYFDSFYHIHVFQYLLHLKLNNVKKGNLGLLLFNVSNL